MQLLVAKLCWPAKTERRPLSTPRYGSVIVGVTGIGATVIASCDPYVSVSYRYCCVSGFVEVSSRGWRAWKGLVTCSENDTR
ncbi:hypothetical protein Tco_1476311 [Tanacetum coccineum]